MLEIASSLQNKSTLKLVSRLCQTLENEGINYCHWKSNNALDRSANGENDLDLLVGRKDIQKFTEILFRLGFKQAKTPLEQQMPSVLDYYGYDADADKLVHVHAHYQLIIGHDRTKNYHLPIEKPFLESVTQGELFRTPSVEFEFIVFVIRMILKYSTWDAIITRQGDLPSSAKDELVYLQKQVNWMQIYNHLQQYLPYINAQLFNNCLESLQPNYPIWERIQLGHQIQKQLQVHARRIHILDVYLKLSRQISRALGRRIMKKLPKKRFVNGGVMIALVGGDGAGKSTAIDQLYSWLSKDFDTIKVHLGKPPWSLTTITIRGLLKIGRLIESLFNKQSDLASGKETNNENTPEYSPLLWEVCAARDRYRSYGRAKRFATNGGIVICDRFPLPEIKLMDGPQIERRVDIIDMNRFTKFLIKLEQHWYQYISLPELVIVLKLDPEIAVERKTTEPESHVRPRSTEIWELDWQQTPALIIDASRSKEEVIDEIKSLVWSIL
jgi:thymidylate kinase